MSEPISVTDIPVPNFRRNPATGLDEGKTYIRRPDGRINWAAMIDPAYIVFNKKLDKTGVIEKVYGEKADKLVYSEVIKKQPVDEKHILVLLMGFFELAALRGGDAVPRIAHVTSYPVEAANVTCECTIRWIPNEEEPNGFTSYGTADATMENTSGWGYLAAMAGNRAFVRAVRQGLRIPILGFDEIAKKEDLTPDAPPNTAVILTPINSLEKAAKLHKGPDGKAAPLDFEGVRAIATGECKSKIEDDPAKWTKFEEISPADCLTLIKAIKSRGKVKKAE